MTQAQRDECIEIRQKCKAENKSNDEPQSKIAAFETQIKEMREHLISVMNSSSNNTAPPLPPRPSNSSQNGSAPKALHPPPRFSQNE